MLFRVKREYIQKVYQIFFGAFFWLLVLLVLRLNDSKEWLYISEANYLSFSDDTPSMHGVNKETEQSF